MKPSAPQPTTKEKIINFIKAFAEKWSAHSPARMAASLSYYTVFSVGPLLMTALGIAGILFGAEAARGELKSQLESLMGPTAAEAIQGLAAASPFKSSGVISTVVGLVVFLLGATALFTELRTVLNTVWGVTTPKRSWALNLLKDRMLAFLMVFSIGLLLLLSFVANTVLLAVTDFMHSAIPISKGVLAITGVGVSLAITTLFFALIFKLLPDTDIKWGDVWVGAGLTAVLFNIGKQLITLYLGRSAISSVYGASASVVVIMVWAYYSSLILLIGAEFTRTYCDNCGSRKPKVKSVP